MKNSSMLSVGLSSYGCTRKVWGAREKVSLIANERAIARHLYGQVSIWSLRCRLLAMLLEAIAGSASTYTSSLQTSQVHPPGGGGTLIQRWWGCSWDLWKKSLKGSQGAWPQITAKWYQRDTTFKICIGYLVCFIARVPLLKVLDITVINCYLIYTVKGTAKATSENFLKLNSLIVQNCIFHP